MGHSGHMPRAFEKGSIGCADSDGSTSFNSSTASFFCDALGDTIIPLRVGDGANDEGGPARHTRAPRRNSLQGSIQTLTEQLSKGCEQLPLSPGPKKKGSVNGFSPRTLSGMRSLGRHSGSPGPLAGSLHGKPGTKSGSPGLLGGSLHGNRRRRSPPARPRSFNAGDSRPMSRDRSKSPGPLGGSSHGRASFGGGVSRARPMLALAGRTGSFRLPRPQSKKNLNSGLASILRRGKFSQTKDTESPTPILTTIPCESPFGFSGCLGLNRGDRKSVV